MLNKLKKIVYGKGEESKNSDSDEAEFHDAWDSIEALGHELALTTNNNSRKMIKTNEGELDPEERKELPYLRDPNIKFSVWSIIKDSIGKDLSKVSVPVYFNQPLSIL